MAAEELLLLLLLSHPQRTGKVIRKQTRIRSQKGEENIKSFIN